MPGKDGTGPIGDGSIGGGGGRRGQGNSFGAPAYCICPQCGERVAHQAGLPCTSVKCPKCQALMIRE
ncbi:hypothetical protein [Acetobacterium sp. KB-1]|uniref:hypothetical protein n=1 Tax=Acetobacterium sp. KB-1 TaxID=2184575 RepID=UPI000DBEB474|nr:hypothetical protein [Acetobacterium sp. KB-1]AWW26203.1 hypothetical protein DOZ58_05730 [Acetobacterium sp. KB-1]